MSGLVLFFVFFFPIIVVAVRSVGAFRKPEESIALPTDASAALKGYMALMILWGHDTGGYYFVDGVQQYPWPWAISALRLGIQCTGFLLVGIFFALSAYGCRKKWAADPNYLTGFLTKRMIKVWLPFVLIGTSLGLVKKCIWGG